MLVQRPMEGKMNRLSRIYKAIRPWAWAVGTLVVMIFLAIYGAFRNGIRFGKAEGEYKADLKRIDEITESGDTTKMKEDLLRRARDL